MLLETFHWDPGTLAKTDIDLVLPLISYFPYWKEKHSTRQNSGEEVFADQVDWM